MNKCGGKKQNKTKPETCFLLFTQQPQKKKKENVMQSCCLRCDCFKLCEGKIVFACDEKHLFKEFSASFESMNSDV